ncbi:MAG TPA: PHB depolymerase family esterase, partial [Longimicrobiaceae bacterium]|nr:PHB depolymerase family esterase [Longimicrobiaceae bacterium]
AYPELYGGVAVHSGTAYRGAGDVLRALAVMKQGPAPVDSLAPALTAALNGKRPPPLLVFHGGADAVVVPANGRALAAQWAAAAGTTVTEQERLSTGAFRVEFVAWGRDVELWVIDGLGHAWSGGSSDGTYTDPRGPDASREILRFLLTHVR